jgi:hypothetical protein
VRRKGPTVFASTFLLMLAVAVQGRAECLIPPPPCEALAAADYVFVADTPWVQWFEADPERVGFMIVERFRGVPREHGYIEASVFVHNAEAVSFHPDRRYLVYAIKRSDGVWSTVCSRTRTIRPDDKEVASLRKCSR